MSINQMQKLEGMKEVCEVLLDYQVRSSNAEAIARAKETVEVYNDMKKAVTTEVLIPDSVYALEEKLNVLKMKKISPSGISDKINRYISRLNEKISLMKAKNAKLLSINSLVDELVKYSTDPELLSSIDRLIESAELLDTLRELVNDETVVTEGELNEYHKTEESEDVPVNSNSYFKNLIDSDDIESECDDEDISPIVSNTMNLYALMGCCDDETEPVIPIDINHVSKSIYSWAKDTLNESEISSVKDNCSLILEMVGTKNERKAFDRIFFNIISENEEGYKDIPKDYPLWLLNVEDAYKKASNIVEYLNSHDDNDSEETSMERDVKDEEEENEPVKAEIGDESKRLIEDTFEVKRYLLENECESLAEFDEKLVKLIIIMSDKGYDNSNPAILELKWHEARISTIAYGHSKADEVMDYVVKNNTLPHQLYTTYEEDIKTIRLAIKYVKVVESMIEEDNNVEESPSGSTSIIEVANDDEDANDDSIDNVSVIDESDNDASDGLNVIREQLDSIPDIVDEEIEECRQYILDDEGDVKVAELLEWVSTFGNADIRRVLCNIILLLSHEANDGCGSLKQMYRAIEDMFGSNEDDDYVKISMEEALSRTKNVIESSRVKLNEASSEEHLRYETDHIEFIGQIIYGLNASSILNDSDDVIAFMVTNYEKYSQLKYYSKAISTIYNTKDISYDEKRIDEKADVVRGYINKAASSFKSIVKDIEFLPPKFDSDYQIDAEMVESINKTDESIVKEIGKFLSNGYESLPEKSGMIPIPQVVLSKYATECDYDEQVGKISQIVTLCTGFIINKTLLKLMISHSQYFLTTDTIDQLFSLLRSGEMTIPKHDLFNVINTFNKEVASLDIPINAVYDDKVYFENSDEIEAEYKDLCDDLFNTCYGYINKGDRDPIVTINNKDVEEACNKYRMTPAAILISHNIITALKLSITDLNKIGNVHDNTIIALSSDNGVYILPSISINSNMNKQ